MEMVRRGVILGALILGCMILAPIDASARGRSRGCCSPCYSSCYSSCYDYCYDPCCCPTHCCYSPCYGAAINPCPGGHCSVMHSTPYYAATPAAAQPIAAVAVTKPAPTTGTLKVSVPAAARVYVNGVLTKTTGKDRHYISPGLVAGVSYKYEVRVELAGASNPIVETKTVVMSAGGEQKLAFDLGPTLTLPVSLTAQK